MIFSFLQHITFILKHKAFNTVDALIRGYRANDEPDKTAPSTKSLNATTSQLIWRKNMISITI